MAVAGGGAEFAEGVFFFDDFGDGHVEEHGAFDELDELADVA